MYFGGEIINASECDYESSKNLGLICPFCSSAVFVRSESVREAKGKLQLVRPYFAHYPSGLSDNWDCEKRSRSKQGREEIEQIKIQARNQRLRLYNAHLWRMIAEDRNISHQMLNKVRSQFGQRWCEEQSILARHELKLCLDGAYTFIDAALQEIENKNSSLFSPSARPPGMNAQTYLEEAKKQNSYLMECDRRLHRAICFEVVDFLATDTGGFAFLNVYKACLVLSMMISGANGEREIRRMSPRSHIPTIAGFIAGTHWVDQINKRLSNVQSLNEAQPIIPKSD